MSVRRSENQSNYSFPTQKQHVTETLSLTDFITTSKAGNLTIKVYANAKITILLTTILLQLLLQI
jgi:preprotein translocase subunit Sec63